MRRRRKKEIVCEWVTDVSNPLWLRVPSPEPVNIFFYELQGALQM